MKTPFFSVTLPYFLMPGIFTTEKALLSPARYSMGCVSLSRPETSWNDITAVSHFTSKRNFGIGQLFVDCFEPSSAISHLRQRPAPWERPTV